MREVFHVRTPLAPGTDALLPLDALRTLDPPAYARAIAKYDDTPERRRLRDTVVPLIAKRWTEVVFLSPVHPHATWRAWREISGRALPPVEFWAIPVDDVPSDAVVFDRRRSLVAIRSTCGTWHPSIQRLMRREWKCRRQTVSGSRTSPPPGTPVPGST